MKANRHNRGSVLMEFVIVFPIYLVLFGGVFMIGDMLVHTTRLASSERVVAFGVQLPSGINNALNWIRRDLFHNSDSNGVQREFADNGGNQDDVNYERYSQWFAGTNVDHPFSLRAAMKMRDRYLLPVGGTAGRLWFSYQFLRDATPATGADPLGDNASDILGLWQDRRILIHSKDEGGRARLYNYYTLKRTKYGNGFLTWRDNRRYSSDLLAHSSKKRAWNSQVYGEDWYAAESDSSNSKTFVRYASEYADYQRYGKFVEWSE